jgi:hypothetical protein
MMSFLRPVFLTASTKRGSFQELMIRRSITGTSGRAAMSSGKIGPLGPFGLLAVKITGNPNARADSASKSVWFLSSIALRSVIPKFIVPT